MLSIVHQQAALTLVVLGTLAAARQPPDMQRHWPFLQPFLGAALYCLLVGAVLRATATAAALVQERQDGRRGRQQSQERCGPWWDCLMHPRARLLRCGLCGRASGGAHTGSGRRGSSCGRNLAAGTHAAALNPTEGCTRQIPPQALSPGFSRVPFIHEGVHRGCTRPPR